MNFRVSKKSPNRNPTKVISFSHTCVHSQTLMLFKFLSLRFAWMLLVFREIKHLASIFSFFRDHGRAEASLQGPAESVWRSQGQAGRSTAQAQGTEGGVEREWRKT